MPILEQEPNMEDMEKRVAETVQAIKTFLRSIPPGYKPAEFWNRVTQQLIDDGSADHLKGIADVISGHRWKK